MKKILIVGGYGAVGSIISEQLSLHYPGMVVVAGRNFNSAKRMAEKLNKRVVPYQLDLSSQSGFDILDETGLVVMCIDQPDTQFVEVCIDKRINYIDITATQAVISSIELLNDRAKMKKVSIILSVGLAPGVTNLLAQYCTRLLPDGKWINLFILLGLGEKHGDAAYQWTFDNLHTRYRIKKNDQEIELKSFTSPETTHLLGKRTFYLFNFSDQHSLIKTLRLESVKTRMAFDSRFLTQVMAVTRKTGLTRILRNKKVQSRLLPLFKQTLIGDEIYGAKAVIRNKKGETKECSLTGKGEGNTTAYVATLVALLMLSNQPKYGVSHLQEIISDIPGFLNKLQQFDDSIEMKL